MDEGPDHPMSDQLTADQLTADHLASEHLTADHLTGAAMLRLMQLASPALPIGAFAYSQGLEPAVEAGWVHDEESASDWILGILVHALGATEVPILHRLRASWQAGDLPGVRRWNAYLYATRATAELQAEDRRLGDAMARVLATLGIEGTAEALAPDPLTHLAAYARAAVVWEIPVARAAQGYLFSWVEAQIGAACRLVPLGQSAAQRLLARAIALIPQVVATGARLRDDDIGCAATSQAIASTLHETQYSRIFRS